MSQAKVKSVLELAYPREERPGESTRLVSPD